MTILAESARTEPALDEVDRRVLALIEVNPFRLYTLIEARRILFGDEVSEQQRPTENWINAKVRRKVIKSTKFGSAVWFSLEDIKVLRRTFARTEYGLPKYPAKRAKK